MASRSVSRILWWNSHPTDGHLSGASVTADLDAAHLQTSSGQLVCTDTRKCPLGLAPDGVYLAARVTTDAGGLLHHRFTLTDLRPAVCFLLHFPAGRPGWVLPTVLPCGVRTFLDHLRDRGRPTDSPLPVYAGAPRDQRRKPAVDNRTHVSQASRTVDQCNPRRHHVTHGHWKSAHPRRP